MDSFKRRTAIRIASVSILLAAVASPGAWFVAHRNAEDGTVSLAVEESRRLLHHFGVLELAGPDARDNAQRAAGALTGGLFEVAEIYDRTGRKLAEATTAEGAVIEARLPGHARPDYREGSHESLVLDDGRWVLRVFVPLRDAETGDAGPIAGYFEGVRVVSAWQRRQLLDNALSAALMAGLASILCGAAIYPVVVRLVAENDRKAREVLDSHVAIMEALGRAIAQRDSDTGSHNFRVAWIAARVGERMDLGAEAMQALIAGSFLHDVGKISVPDAILLKPGKLDPDESDVMRAHVAHGEEILADIGWLADAKAVVAGHHEKWDGSGYPRGLTGPAIPLSARIFAVADVFDALCSERPYKKPMRLDAAMAVLEAGTGSHFDPDVMAAFRPIAREVFDALSGWSGLDVRERLQEMVRRHFGI